ncbi:inhibitor kappa b [Plakobranchus ocellatus]|uniref:Inhibitor kappa b n=1 Tax=Plakobranchus ocellatus TaxID=259542 RepID=A0AAV3Y6U3_9GAST|nr:inhibitor kappa b [Plakobranchus ocellatus]
MNIHQLSGAICAGVTVIVTNKNYGQFNPLYHPGTSKLAETFVLVKRIILLLLTYALCILLPPKGQDNSAVRHNWQPTVEMAATTTSSLTTTSTTYMEGRLFEQNDSGIDSLPEFLSSSSMDFSGQNLEVIDELSTTNSEIFTSSVAPHHKHFSNSRCDDNSKAKSPQSSKLMSLTSGFLSLNLDSPNIDNGITEPDGTEKNLNCMEREKLEMLERQEVTVAENLCGLMSDHDSGLFSITTPMNDLCEEENLQKHCENNVEDIRNIEDEKAEESPSCIHSTMQSKERNIVQEQIITYYLTAEQRVALYQGDADGDNWLHLSIINGRMDLATALINLAPDYFWLSYSNLRRQTPLHLAVLTGQARLARRLVCAGAIVDVQDLRGDTPLHIACRMGYDDMVKMLLTPVRFEETQRNVWEIPYQRLPQDLGVRNFDGQSPLHVAVISGHQRIVQLLLNAGADPNIGEAKSGRTALHLASERGRVELVELLACKPEMDLLKRDYGGLTAAQLAHGRNLDPIAQFLQADCDNMSDAESEATMVASDSDEEWSDDAME